MDAAKLDKEFFQGVLRNYEKNDSIVVENVDISPAVEKGNNFASVVSRVAIKGIKVENNNEKSAYRTFLIIKQLVKNKVLLETFRFDVIFVNESEAYNTIIPTLAKYTPIGSLNTAQCLLATKDIVILKDLSQEGYINMDKRKDVQLKDALLTLTELAKLHAASFVLKEEDPQKLDHLGTLIEDIHFSNNNRGTLVNLQYVTFQLAIYIFQHLDPTPQNLHAIKVLKDLKENAGERQNKLMNQSRKHKVINHGDAWKNNILKKGNSVILIDLQIMRYASIAADLSYYLYINMHPFTRRQTYNALLLHYLDILHEQMLACGVDLRSELTAEWLRKEMNDFALYGMTSALWILPVFHYDMSNIDMDDYKEEDWNTLDWHIEKITDGFRKRVVELVLDYVDHNVM